MTHELKNIFEAYLAARAKGMGAVLSTVVDLDGSSYRKPGVRMLILENGQMVGAVSGGCVEKEIWKNVQEVLSSGRPRMIQYDGRYRLGCEGLLHILIEPFEPDQACVEIMQRLFDVREEFDLLSDYRREAGGFDDIGSRLLFSNETYNFRDYAPTDQVLRFEQHMSPELRLTIFGTEHDTLALSALASQLGWDVVVVVPIDDPREVGHFPGADRIVHSDLSAPQELPVDASTAVVVMNHNYSRDLQCIMQLRNYDLLYFGLLGPAKRREQLIYDLMERIENLNEDLLDRIHGPAGLDIGSETPQEIALSILAEIVAVVNKREVSSLRDKTSAIHAN